MDNVFISVGKLAVWCFLVTKICGSEFEYDVSIHKKVTHDAEHWWNFDEATSLYSIVDKVSETRATMREGGAKLTRHDLSTNNYLTLEGYSSSIELGRFEKCIGDISRCSTGFTFSLWLRLRDAVEENQYILGNKNPGTTEQGFCLLRTNRNEMKVEVRDSSGETHLTYASSSGKWFHHLVTWDGHHIYVYLNGQMLIVEGSKLRKRRFSFENGKEENGIRKRRGIGSGLFSLGRHGFKIDADYDDVMVWNRNLNRTEAAVMYYRDLVDPVITGCSSIASSICLKWTLPNDAFNRTRALSLSYHYLYQTGPPLEIALNSTTREKCVGFLGSLTTYVFIVQAHIGNAVRTLRSKEINCRTTDGVPNSPNLSIGDKTATSIEVVWRTPSPANGAIIAYSVLVKEKKTNAVKVRIKMNAHESLPGTIGTYRLNVTSLLPGVKYSISVQAISEMGKSVASNVEAVTKGIYVPTTDDSNTAQVTGDKMKIGWKFVEHALSYRVYVRPVNGNETHFNVKKNSTELASLKPSTCYVINVKPVFSWGMGPRIVKDFKVKTPSQKIIPTGVKAATMGWERVLVKWTPLANKDATYIVYLKTDDGKELSRDTKHSQIIFDNLKPLTTYSIYIQTEFSWGLGPKTYANAVAKTKDLNECKQPAGNKCHKNADCFNVEGSYLCQCRKGFVGDGFNCRPMPKNAKRSDFCEGNIFRDIKWPKIFNGGTAVRKCPNGTKGFASRNCLYDVNSQSSIYALPNLSDCVSEDVVMFGNMVENPRADAKLISDQLKKITTSDKLYGGDVRKTVVYYDKFIDKKLKNDELVQGLSQNLLDAAGNLLNNTVLAAWNDLPKGDRSEGATKLFNGLETLGGKQFKTYNESSLKKSFSTGNIDMELQRVDNPNGQLEYIEPNLSAENMQQSKISLPTNEIMAAKGGKKTTDVIYFSYTNVNKILGIEKPLNTNKERASMNVLNSRVVSAVIVGSPKMVFQSPVVLVLPHLKEEPVINTSCVFLNISKSPQSKWLDTGCYVNHTDINETICHCYHLTNFAVLMTVSAKPTLTDFSGHQFTLRVITIVGLTISIIAMSIAFVTFCCFRFLRSARTTYHAHLVASLILANLLFLIGIDKTSNKIACSTIAMLLHYLFTVAFVWMAMEGILLYFMLKKIFSNRNFLKRKRCYALCWGLPAVYVAVLGGLKIEHYGNESFCWLSRREGFIWSFVVPVSLALIINFTVMGFAFQVMSEKRNKGPDDGTISDVWYWLKGLLVLSCLLGVTWILGVFYIDSNTIGFAYVFTLLNALQGLFIFIFHCFIDSRVRSEYLRLIKCQKRSDYNEKAGYSSSMKFRKLSGSIKSLGSLDRSLSHSSAKRTMSNSLDRSLLRQNNGSISEYGRFTLLRSTSSNKSDKNDMEHGNLPEIQPLVQSSFSAETEDQANQSKENATNGLHLHDEKAGSSYSSVFEPENEPRQSRVIDVRDSLCIIDPVITSNKQRWNNQTHGSDSGVSVHSEALQGESFESNPIESSQASFEEPKKNADEEVVEWQPQPSSQAASLSSFNNEAEAVEAVSKSCQSLNSDLERVQHEGIDDHSLTKEPVEASKSTAIEADPLKIKVNELAVEKELTMELITDKSELTMDALYEESQTFCHVEESRFSMHFDRLEDASSSADEADDSVFADGCKVIRMSQVSPVKMNRMIQFEVEDLPQIRSSESIVRCGSPDKRERVETSLRIGGPRLISVSSIESEPISPIIISINPENKEFSMLEAEIEFSDDALSTYSET